MFHAKHYVLGIEQNDEYRQGSDSTMGISRHPSKLISDKLQTHEYITPSNE